MRTKRTHPRHTGRGDIPATNARIPIGMNEFIPRGRKGSQASLTKAQLLVDGTRGACDDGREANDRRVRFLGLGAHRIEGSRIRHAKQSRTGGNAAMQAKHVSVSDERQTTHTWPVPQGRRSGVGTKAPLSETSRRIGNVSMWCS